MSEKIYRFLLHFYPSRFRRQYGDEAMQVFRDRLRDERGFFRRARLWLDVVRDLTVSAPREYGRAAGRPVRTASGVPSFLVLEEERLRPDMFLLGTVLAVVALGTFGYLLTHGGNRVLLPAVLNPLQSAMAPAADAKTGERSASNPEGGASEAVVVTAVERELVIRRVIGAVRRYDPDRGEAQGVAAMLQEAESRGDYAGMRNGSVFAQVLTQEIDGVSQHERVTVMCGHEPLRGSSIWVVPARPGEPAWLRIDEHFSVALAPAKDRE
ncbi:MAG: hypothetical protein WB622_20435 [Acidobacteriaceae bacterium]